jgi:ubiquinone/menaquinone biosynthesis C-methylase UbiE
LSKQLEQSDEPRVPSGLRRRLQNATFAALYHFGGRIYDPLTQLLFGGAWGRWRRSIIAFLPQGSVLDLGCGTGSFVNELNAKGYVAFGIDREPSMLRQARTLTGTRKRLVRGDARILPFRAACFDACVATFPSRFILQQRTLDEVVRVLRPGGVFAVVLSGDTNSWPLHRRPIRLVLQLVYGARESQRPPDASVIAHPALTGEWRRLAQGSDRVLVWIGTRTETIETVP